jgi:hypothetical protein
MKGTPRSLTFISSTSMNDYEHRQIAYIADQLFKERSPLRRALGKHLIGIAEALRAINLNNEQDEPEDEVIRQAIGQGAIALELGFLIEDAQQAQQALAEILSRPEILTAQKTSEDAL